MKFFIKIILVVILGMFIVGCDNNLLVNNPEDDNVNYENFVPSDMTYYKTLKKEITHDNVKYDFDFIYFYGYNDADGYVMYQTVLLNNKLVSSELNTMIIYKDYYDNVEGLKKDTDKLIKDLNNITNSIIKDNNSEKQYLLLDIKAARSLEYKYVFVFDGENLILNLKDMMNNAVSFDSNYYRKIEINANTIYHLECPNISTYKIESGKVIKGEIKIPVNASYEGGKC